MDTQGTGMRNDNVWVVAALFIPSDVFLNSMSGMEHWELALFGRS